MVPQKVTIPTCFKEYNLDKMVDVPKTSSSNVFHLLIKKFPILSIWCISRIPIRPQMSKHLKEFLKKEISF